MTVTADGAGTGTYGFRLRTAPPHQAFEISDGNLIETDLIARESRPGAGTIAAPGDTDAYEFLGDKDQEFFLYGFSCDTVSDLLLTVVRPNGDPLEDIVLCRKDRPISQWVRLEQSGEHQLVISGRGPATGTYSFKFYEVPYQDFFIGYDTPVWRGNPEAGAGEILPAGQADLYWFPGEAGDQVTIQIEDCSYSDASIPHEYGYSFNLWGTLEGNLDRFPLHAYQGCVQDQRQKTVTLPANGSYLITVKGDITGTYSFRVTKD